MKKYTSARKLNYRMAVRLIRKELGFCPQLNEVGSGAHFFEGVVGNFRITVSQIDDDTTRIRLTVESEYGGGLIEHYYFADTLTPAIAAIEQAAEEYRWEKSFTQFMDPDCIKKRAEAVARERRDTEEEKQEHAHYAGRAAHAQALRDQRRVL